MSVEEQVYAVLTAHLGLSALVGSRVYPLVLPQGATLPAVVYQRISGPRAGAIGVATYMGFPRVQFTCWGRTYTEAKAVAEQLRLALDGYLGSMNDPADPTAMWFAQLKNDHDDYEPETGRWRVLADYVITEHTG